MYLGTVYLLCTGTVTGGRLVLTITGLYQVPGHCVFTVYRHSDRWPVGTDNNWVVPCT